MDRAEKVANRAWIDFGQGLAEIRHQRLYRATHGTFEAYCKQRWTITDRRARQLMRGAERAYQIESAEYNRQHESGETGTIVPVQNEGQIRELPSDPVQANAAWRSSLEKYGPHPTAAQIHEVIHGADRVSQAVTRAQSNSGNVEWYT